jgi:two-component system, OmpR family, sensor histidine kinase KdpD
VSISAEHRPDPDQLLRQIQAEEAHEKKGRLKVFLGYASGVGKSFRMLDEGRRRKERGQEVVIGALQRKRDPALAHLIEFFEVIPPLCFEQGSEAIDVPTLVKRHPQVCLIDGLAQDNPKQCRNPKRYQDALELLRAGITVITSVNLQYIEELREQVERITGKKVTETVPKSFILAADEIEVVDMPAEQVLERIGRQPNEQAAAEERRRLSELREIALLLAAEVVDHQLASYLKIHGIEQTLVTQERILVSMTARADFRTMIAVGAHIARRFHGEMHVVYVQQTSLDPDDKARLDAQLAFARESGAIVEVLAAEDPMDAILRYARAHGITQIFIGHSLRQNWWNRLFGTPVDYLIRNAEGIDVCIFPH